MSEQTLNNVMRATLYCCAVVCPMIVYVYYKKIKHGVIISTLAVLGMIGIMSVIVTFNYTLEQLIMLVIAQMSLFVYVVFDAVKLIKK